MGLSDDRSGMTEKVLVDVVAAADRLGGGSPAAPWEAPAASQDGACPLGHASAPGARFCASCGLPAGEEMVLAPRVDLAAVREAVAPAAGLTYEQRAERDRQHFEAIAAGQQAEAAVPDFASQPDPSAKKILIHFVDDGFTWAGKVWQLSEELVIGPEHPRWEDALRWIRLTAAEQIERYGRIIFGTGPWPGRRPQPGEEIELPEASRDRVFAGRRSSIPANAVDGALVPWTV